MICVVLETKGRTAIVLNDSCEFMRIKNRDFKPGQRIVISDLKSPRIKFAAAAALTTMLVFFVTFVCAYCLPYSELNLNAGPVILLRLNCLNQVVEACAENEEAAKFVDSLDLGYNDAPSAIRKICGALMDRGYITGETFFAVRVRCEDRARAQEMLDSAVHIIEQETGKREIRPTIHAHGVD